MQKLISFKKEHSVFDGTADVRTVDTWEDSILGVIRENDEEKLVELYNFGRNGRIAWINEDDGLYTDLISGGETEAKAVDVPPFGFVWLLKRK